jgi:signal transduction histidine kinase
MGRAEVPRTTGPESQVSDELLDAVLSITSDLSLPGVLRRIVTAACALCDARYGALGVLDQRREGLEQFITVGLSTAEEARIATRPTGRGILGLLISEPRAIRIDEISSDPRSVGFPAGHPTMHSFLGVPIRVRGDVFGNLYLTEKRSAPGFSSADEQRVVLLAAAAGVAIENARLHGRVADLVLVADRERIARDLHDTVIQRLFATGLALQGLVPLIEHQEVARRVQGAIEDLDATIAEIRAAIFDLQARGLAGLRSEVLGVTRAAAGSLGFAPRVVFRGPVDSLVPDEISEHLLASLREALSNVVRHAGATEVQVTIDAGDHLEMTVVDDGVGIGPEGSVVHGHGLKNLAERALELGGEFELRPRPVRGSMLVWRVPLAASSPEPDLEAAPAAGQGRRHEMRTPKRDRREQEEPR